MQEQLTDAVGSYATPIGLNEYRRVPVYGWRPGPFGLQALVNSIGGPAWINVANMSPRYTPPESPQGPEGRQSKGGL